MRAIQGRWLGKRALQALLVLWGLVTLVFVLFYVLPADSAQMTLGQRSDPETLAQIQKELGLDLPWGWRYLHFLNDLSPLSVYRAGAGAASGAVAASGAGRVTGPAASAWWSWRPGGIQGNWVVCLKGPYLGRSYQSRREVGVMLQEAFGGTLVLALTAMLLATVLGIGLGTWAAFTHKPWLEGLIVGGSMVGVAAPSFLVSLVLAYVFGYLLSPWTGLHMSGHLWELDATGGPRLALQNLILPAVTLGLRPLSVVVQLTRDSITEVMKQDYIRTARAKGLSPWLVWWRHTLPNAMNPVVTALSGWLSSLLAGAVFVEYVFGWKGMGKLTVDALMVFDLPVVMGVVLCSGTLFVLVNVLVDWLYTVLDPRVALNERQA